MAPGCACECWTGGALTSALTGLLNAGATPLTHSPQLSVLFEVGPFSCSWTIQAVFAENPGHAAGSCREPGQSVDGGVWVDSGLASGAVADPGVEDFAVAFRLADGVQQHQRLGLCWSVPLEQAVPVRSFPSYRGQKSFSGWWWAATTGEHVGYESWLERDHLMLLDFDPDVVGVAAQPFWLHWRDGHRERRHAPDFFARLTDGNAAVIDVRQTTGLPRRTPRRSPRRRGRVRRRAGATGGSA